MCLLHLYGFLWVLMVSNGFLCVLDAFSAPPHSASAFLLRLLWRWHRVEPLRVKKAKRNLFEKRLVPDNLVDYLMW